MHWAGFGGVMLALSLMSATAMAGQIYSCDQGGHKVFSQEPCGSNATVVHSSNEERSVNMTVDMPSADISYLCGLAMRSWEKVTEDRRNMTTGSYYYGGSYDHGERRATFVLSHIDNLEKIAVNDPELYDVAKSISNRYFGGNAGSYLYGAERARAQSDCERDVRRSIDNVKSRREAEDECKYRRKGCRYSN